MKKNIRVLSRLMATGTEGLLPNSLERKITTLVNQLTVYVALINLLIGLPIYFLVANDSAILIGVVSEILLCSIPLYLNRGRHYAGARTALYLILCAASFYFCCLLGPLTKVEVMAVVLCITAKSIFTNLKFRTFGFGLAILVDIAVHLNARYPFVETLKFDKVAADLLYTAAYAVVIFLVVTTACFYGELRQFFGRRSQVHHR